MPTVAEASRSVDCRQHQLHPTHGWRQWARARRHYAGRPFDAALLSGLPAGVDPCGENGEFHTAVSAGPMFTAPIPIYVGERVERNGFAYADLLPD